jgi:DNA-directed RNA polymerase specialized sigma24 family protein
MDAALEQHESSADIVQSICREVLTSRGNFVHQGDAAFRQWLLQVALHKLIDRRRFYARASATRAGTSPNRRRASTSTSSRGSQVRCALPAARLRCARSSVNSPAPSTRSRKPTRDHTG